MRNYIFEVTSTHTPLAALQAKTLSLPGDTFNVPYVSQKGTLPMTAKLKYYWFSFLLWWNMYIAGRF